MFAVLKLNFKAYNFNTKKLNNNTLILDIIRKKYILLTPEEWVRQHVIHYLVDEIKVPIGLISVEKSLNFNGLNKRFDIVIFNNKGEILVLIECKSPFVKLDEKVIKQAGIYQKVLNPQYIFITNGLNNLVLNMDIHEKKFQLINELPIFSQMSL